MTPGTIPIGEPGAMVSAGLDAKGTAHTILVDPEGRVMCAPGQSQSWAMASVAIVYLVGFFVLLSMAMRRI